MLWLVARLEMMATWAAYLLTWLGATERERSPQIAAPFQEDKDPAVLDCIPPFFAFFENAFVSRLLPPACMPPT